MFNSQFFLFYPQPLSIRIFVPKFHYVLLELSLILILFTISHSIPSPVTFPKLSISIWRSVVWCAFLFVMGMWHAPRWFTLCIIMYSWVPTCHRECQNLLWLGGREDGRHWNSILICSSLPGNWKISNNLPGCVSI